jgi:glycosyltransferase involved in cell wall biosynthesis
MKVGVIIPDRGDRPEFIKHCFWQLERQTVQPDIVEHVNYAPLSDAVDITQRYRRGYDLLRNKGLDVIAFIENDEYYHPTYLETMLTEWGKRGRPDIFGTNYTIYYHLRLAGYFTMYHQDRASAMNTFIKPDLEISWPVDHEPFTDMHLWRQIHGCVIDPGKIISIGMKHGIGKCGGRSHVDKLHRYQNLNDGFLEKTIDPESYKFYRKFYEPTFNKSATSE